MPDRAPDRSIPTSLDSLPSHARRLLVSCLEETDSLWDPAAGLVGSSPDGPAAVRATGRYAVGLLVRDGGEDRERAREAIESILRYQFTDDPDAAYYGTWARSPGEYPAVTATDDPEEWTDYDPNWREFVGTNLSLVHDAFEAELPDGLRERIAQAIHAAARGTLERDVSPGYTNIALMRAFLLRWAGDRFDDGEWLREAERYAGEIYDLFGVGETFCEFNSPTYVGVSLSALGYWVTSGRSGPLHGRGAEMEAAVWRQLGEFYHAGLRRLCGPYARAYAMDTRRSNAEYYLWLAAGGTEWEPFPGSHHTEIPGNYGTGILAPLLGGWKRAPAEAVTHVRSFRGQRELERVIGCGTHRKTATAWLGERAMAGGFSFPEGADAPSDAGAIE